ncbi:MAG TPA: LCP family protein [Candidatus Limnocylindrales bacterium]|nr:LCP family protein [Candidatus Limnocylindrales bacterium]
MQARARRPEQGRADGRRIVAAVLSSIVPGLGQAMNHDRRSIVVFGLPVAILIVLGLSLWLALQARLLALLLKPDAVLALLMVNLLLLAWRLAAVAHAFALGGSGPVGRLGMLGLVGVLAWTAVPQAAGGWVGLRVYETTQAVCVSCRIGNPPAQPGLPTPTPLFPGDDPGSTAGPTPMPEERINILLLGIDSRPTRRHALADTIIVASVDPLGKTVSMLSIPRDLVDVPLPNGKRFRPKINSLLSHVNAKPDDPAFAWAKGSGTRALQDAVGTLLGIRIHYYAKVDLPGFIRVVDAVGGVDIRVRKRLAAPDYADFGVYGFVVEPGRHHFDGKEALAYARIRKANGESDFTRAARQQEVLLAVRDAALDGGALALLGRLDRLLKAVEGAIRTDLPPDRFSDLAFLAEEIGANRVTNVVLQHPLVRPGRNDPRGSIQIPDVAAIRRMAAKLFPDPGEPPVPWPSPTPTRKPRASASPTLTP